MAVLNVFCEEGLRSLGIRPWICVFFFKLIFFIFIQMDQEAMSMLTVLIFQHMIFIISMDMQTFAFVHYIFSTHQYLEKFCTMLYYSSRSPIWYSMMSRNINVNLVYRFQTL
jgi:hypothetical protein